MNYWKRIFFMSLLIVAGFSAIHWLMPREQVTFTIIEGQNTVLYGLDDTLTATVLWSAPECITYADGTACYIVYDDDTLTSWSLMAADVASGLTRSIGEGAQEGHIADYRTVLSASHVYLPVSVSENSRIVDTYIMEFALDGSGGRIFRDLNFSLFSPLHVTDETLCYIDEETMTPMAFHMDTGQTQILSDKPVLWLGNWTYVDDGRFWYVTAEGDAAAYWEGTSTDLVVNLSGISLKDGSVTTVPLKTYLTDGGDYWLHDGYLYTFQNRRLISEGTTQTYADLYQMDVNTRNERCICQEVPYNDNFPPNFNFGKRGIVVTDTILTVQGYEETIYYIPYDGSGATPVHMP